MPAKKFKVQSSKFKVVESLGFTLIELLVVVAITVSAGFIFLPKLVDFKQNQDLNDQAEKIKSIVKQAQNYSTSGYLCGDNYNLNQKAIDWHLVFQESNFYLEPTCSNGPNLPKTSFGFPADLLISQIYFDDPNSPGSTLEGGVGSRLNFANISAKITFTDGGGIPVVNKSRMVIVIKSKTSGGVVNLYIDYGGLIYIH